MKLRNKKTGEIITAVFADVDFMSADDIANCPCDEVRYYHTLAELNADWEDYTPQEEIVRQLISSPYDTDFYWADERQQEAFREFCRKEDSRPENHKIPTDIYSDNAQCLSKDFGGVLSGNDRPRNMSEFNAWRSGDDFLIVREENEQLGKERWLHFVEEHGLEKFVEHKDSLIQDEKIRKAVRAVFELWGVEKLTVNSTQYLLITTIIALGKGYKLEIPNININGVFTIAALCGEEE